MFNAPSEIEQLLTTQGKGMHIELQGRVNSSRFGCKWPWRTTAQNRPHWYSRCRRASNAAGPDATKAASSNSSSRPVNEVVRQIHEIVQEHQATR